MKLDDSELSIKKFFFIFKHWHSKLTLIQQSKHAMFTYILLSMKLNTYCTKLITEPPFHIIL